MLLPHLAGRPLTLKRYPDGVEGKYFYEKRCPAHRPDVGEHGRNRRASAGRARSTTASPKTCRRLIWAANLANIELHTSLSRAEDMNTPTAIVFDLDPGAPAGLKECCRVALLDQRAVRRL